MHLLLLINCSHHNLHMEAMSFLSAFDNLESAPTTSHPKVDRRKQLKSIARILLLSTASILLLV
jgi:hypothetical protein